MQAVAPLIYVRCADGVVEVINLAHVLMVTYMPGERPGEAGSVELMFSGEVLDSRCAPNRREYLGDQCDEVMSQLIELSPKTALVPIWPKERRVC